jgi:hypothetical protein
LFFRERERRALHNDPRNGAAKSGHRPGFPGLLGRRNAWKSPEMSVKAGGNSNPGFSGHLLPPNGIDVSQVKPLPQFVSGCC